jgi:hypothetical protein
LDSILQAVAMEKTPWMKDLFIAVNVLCQKQPKQDGEVKTTMGMLYITANILDY